MWGCFSPEVICESSRGRENKSNKSWVASGHSWMGIQRAEEVVTPLGEE